MCRLRGWVRVAGAMGGLFCCLSSGAGATPTTHVWTPAVADVQPYRVWHLTYDAYFTVGRKPKKGGYALPVDLGLTVGVLPYKNASLEVGVDWFEPTDYPLQFNAKFGVPEGAAGKGAPGLAAGIYGVGLKRDVTTYNVVYGVVSKTLRALGRAHVGYYRGSAKLLVGPDGKADERGLMVAFNRALVKNRLSFSGEWQQGRNLLGATALGLTCTFAPNVSVSFGYVIFNSEKVNGKPVMAVELDIDIK